LIRIATGGEMATTHRICDLLPLQMVTATRFKWSQRPNSGSWLMASYRRREMEDGFIPFVVLTVLLGNAQFPFWPSEPPRALFCRTGPPVLRHGFPPLQFYGCSATMEFAPVSFRSPHIAGALATAFGMRLALPVRIWEELPRKRTSGCRTSHDVAPKLPEAPSDWPISRLFQPRDCSLPEDPEAFRHPANRTEATLAPAMKLEVVSHRQPLVRVDRAHAASFRSRTPSP
jgi:hypothetical protein